MLADANALLAVNDPPRSQQDAALSPHETGFRNALVLAFAKERFSVQDLWRERPGSHAWPALYEDVGAARWPERAWAERMRRELTRLPGVEPAPGPRGGEGWRVSPTVAEQIIGKREDAKAARAAKNSRQRTAAAALSSRFATVTLDEAAQRVEARYPRVKLTPRQEWGVLQPVHVATIIEDWSRTHRYVGLSVADGTVACDWQHAGKLARVLAQLDVVVAHHIEAAANTTRGCWRPWHLTGRPPWRRLPIQRVRAGADDGKPRVEARLFLVGAKTVPPALHLPDTFAAAPLGRLLTIARSNTGQSYTVANFLLAWWVKPRGSPGNAKDCGGWNLADLWAVDSAIADDMVAVVGFISRNSEYPDAYGLGGEFVALVDQWRPHLCAGPE